MRSYCKTTFLVPIYCSSQSFQEIRVSIYYIEKLDNIEKQINKDLGHLYAGSMIDMIEAVSEELIRAYFNDLLILNDLLRFQLVIFFF